MFEKWFGGKKKVEGINSDKNSVEGVAHFDGTKTEKDLLGDKNDHLQDVFDKNDINSKIKKDKTNWYRDESGNTKSLNERKKIKLGEKHSDWKEQEPFALDLSEEVEDKQTLNEKHLNAMAERYDDEDDYEGGNFEKAA